MYSRSNEQPILNPMHQSKGLEYRAVIVMACDDEIIPFQSRIVPATKESDHEVACITERNLLQVNWTSSQDKHLITVVKPGLEFLKDMCEIS